ncbi:hypothetical protein PtA15_4A198 [Puccinia triticina]|uniref:Uncharacterized protein n=1 Tax=Puccinia triticina TaxID=208348 RepID=A0ABY7CIW2_9BASI|nr:uncharacterized protein PtA15_4A198 [Puccinia triticina]WAQ83750.1 hypothetical protein PtA15_4A198 [Puccinia triticina]
MPKDVYADEGPASMVILAGSLLGAAEKLLATDSIQPSLLRAFRAQQSKAWDFSSQFLPWLILMIVTCHFALDNQLGRSPD